MHGAHLFTSLTTPTLPLRRTTVPWSARLAFMFGKAVNVSVAGSNSSVEL